ncbi:hypothetical protein KHP62_12170 [Rhodobacteraceae bacterium NNCM2]|nr:hypothetical protein [Coraliihabitans acroporae]
MRRLRNGFRLLAHSGSPLAGRRRDRWSVEARQAMLRRWPGWVRPLAGAAMALCWPVASFAQARQAAAQGNLGKAEFWRMWWQGAIRRNVPPREYMHYQLWRDGALTLPWSFERETATLLGQLTAGNAAALISDKASFAAWLAGREVPCVPVLTSLPDGDVVLKPRRGARGAGVTAWRPDGDRFVSAEGFGGGGTARATAEELAARAAAEDLVIQPLIGPHPALGAPAVARIVSVREPERPARVLAALIQTPAEGDFCTHRGPFRLVDPATGEVLPPGPGQMTHRLYPAPPEVPFEGALLPGWSLLLTDLARAHDALPGTVPVIGWDVTFGPEGPLVLEGNTGIGLLLFQLDRLEPLVLPIEGYLR